MKKGYYVELTRDNQWFNSRILSPWNGLMEDPWVLEYHLFESESEATEAAERERLTWQDPEEVIFRVMEYAA